MSLKIKKQCILNYFLMGKMDLVGTKRITNIRLQVCDFEQQINRLRVQSASSLMIEVKIYMTQPRFYHGFFCENMIICIITNTEKIQNFSVSAKSYVNDTSQVECQICHSPPPTPPLVLSSILSLFMSFIWILNISFPVITFSHFSLLTGDLIFM